MHDMSSLSAYWSENFPAPSEFTMRCATKYYANGSEKC